MESLWYVTRLEQENFMTSAAAAETNAANNSSIATPMQQQTTTLVSATGLGVNLSTFSFTQPTPQKRSFDQVESVVANCLTMPPTSAVVTPSPASKKPRTTLKDTTRAFVRMNATKDADIDVKKTAKALQTPVRRLYDVANILEGAGVLERAVGTSKTIWKWTSSATPYLSADGESDIGIAHEIHDLQQEEERLDKWLEYYRNVHASWQSLCYITSRDLQACRDSTLTRLVIPTCTETNVTTQQQDASKHSHQLGLSGPWLQDTRKCLLLQEKGGTIQQVPLYTGLVSNGQNNKATVAASPVSSTVSLSSQDGSLPQESNTARSTPTFDSFDALIEAVPMLETNQDSSPPSVVQTTKNTTTQKSSPPSAVEITKNTSQESSHFLKRFGSSESLPLNPFEALVEAAASRCQ